MKKILLLSVFMMVVCSAVYANDKTFLDSVKGKTFIDTNNESMKFSRDGKEIIDEDGTSLYFTGASSKTKGNYEARVGDVTLYVVFTVNRDKITMSGYGIAKGSSKKIPIDTSKGTLR